MTPVVVRTVRCWNCGLERERSPEALVGRERVAPPCPGCGAQGGHLSPEDQSAVRDGRKVLYLTTNKEQ